MTSVVTYQNTEHRCFCQVKFSSGDRVLISIASTPIPSVKVIRLGLGGLLPGDSVWEYNATMAGGAAAYAESVMRMFPPDPEGSTHPLDIIRDVLLTCSSIDQARRVLRERQEQAAAPQRRDIPDEPVEQTVARVEEVVEDFRTFLLAVDAFNAKAIPRSALPYTPDHIQKALELSIQIHHLTGQLTQEEIGGTKGAYLILSTVLEDAEAQLVNTLASMQGLLGVEPANSLLLDLSVFTAISTIVGRLNSAREEADKRFSGILATLGVSA